MALPLWVRAHPEEGCCIVRSSVYGHTWNSNSSVTTTDSGLGLVVYNLFVYLCRDTGEPVHDHQTSLFSIWKC